MYMYGAKLPNKVYAVWKSIATLDEGVATQTMEGRQQEQSFTPQAAPPTKVPPDVPVPRPVSPTLLKLWSSCYPQDQKQFIGEELYRRIYHLQPELTGKITGM